MSEEANTPQPEGRLLPASDLLAPVDGVSLIPDENGTDSQMALPQTDASLERHDEPQRVAQWLASLADCPECRARTGQSEIHIRHWLLLDRWTELGRPLPTFRTLNRHLSEYMPEMEEFLDSCERERGVLG